MKQGRQYLRLIMLVLALMVASYILYNVISSASTGVPTVQAAIFSTSEEEAVSGFIVREEAVITGAYPTVSPNRTEGEKVSKGSSVAVSLQSESARQRLVEISQLENQEAQLRLALSYQTQLADTSALSAKIAEGILEFSIHTARGNLPAADSGGESLKSLVLRQTAGGADAASLKQQLHDIQAQLETLRGQSSADTVTITAPEAGYYSAVADGYESILTPNALETMTLEQYGDLWSREITPPENAVGRLITSDTWYFAAAVNTAALEGISAGDKLTVSFGGDFRKEVKMEVVSMTADSGGETLLVLSCENYLSNISALRRQKASIVFRSYSGLRIPKEAICYSEEEGSAGVYVLEGAKARWKNVTLLYDGGDYYVAELDKSSTRNLWPEDAIILDTHGLEDGKVVIE